MKVPLIKENIIAMLIKSMDCIDEHAFNRETQRECILNLYPNKSEKSVFRGMVIPSLRHLGFIVGYSNLIRLSANGKLLLESSQRETKEFDTVSRPIFLEIDMDKFKFIEEIKNLTLKNNKFTQDYFLDVISKKIEAFSQKQKEERIKRWLKILAQCGLIKKEKNTIRLLYQNLEQAEKNLDWRAKSPMFKKFLFEGYSFLFNKTAGVVDIVDLREYVTLSLYRKKGGVLTESQFDELLRSLPMVTDDCVISLGHPMGAEEKLFLYRGEYYRTLSITFFKESTEHD